MHPQSAFLGLHLITDSKNTRALVRHKVQYSAMLSILRNMQQIYVHDIKALLGNSVLRKNGYHNAHEACDIMTPLSIIAQLEG